MTDLTKLGTYIRNPGGNVENVGEQAAAGVSWALLNVGGDVGFDPTVYDRQRTLYRQAGIPHGPWMHVRSVEKLDWLIAVARDWNADIVGPNIEDTVGDGLSLQEVAGHLLNFWIGPTGGKPVHMATLPWLGNAQGWHHVAFCVIALELFPLEQPLYVREYQACIDHAFQEGAKHVTLLYSTTSPRGVYPNVAHCLYTADNVTDWSAWKDDVEQVVPQPPAPPAPPEVKMLTLAQFPYTGPLYGPASTHPQSRNRSTVKGLKRAMIRLRYLEQALSAVTDDYGVELEEAIKTFQHEIGMAHTGQYGRDTWTALRSEKLTAGPNRGQYAIDVLGRKYVQQDALQRCYPHPTGAVSTICQGLHPTDGLPGNYAIDFCAQGGTKVVAVENATIRQLSGRDPSLGWYGPGIYGWSIHYETSAGYRYFSTHYGSRVQGLFVGQRVDCGEVIATVGRWPGDPGRSHTHLGVTSPLGIADAKKRILAISTSPRIGA